jgi:hypothetical protein
VVTTDQSCPKHRRDACPESCYRSGHTVISVFYGKQVFARTYRTTSAAEQAAHDGMINALHGEANYMDLGLPVPSQYFGWEYKII